MDVTCSPVVVRFGRLGDTILLQPLLHKLSRRYGQPCQLLSLGDWSATLFSAQPEVAGLIPLATQYGPLWIRPERWKAILALRRLRGHPFYIAEPANRARTKIRPMLKLAGIPPEHCQFIEDLPMQEDEHWLDWLSRFSDTTPSAFRDHAGHAIPEWCGAPDLRVSQGEQLDRDEWLRARHWTQRPLVLLQPANKRTMRWNGVRAADDDVKSWPADRWAALAQTMTQAMPHAQILFCGSPAEAGYLRLLKAAVGPTTPAIEIAALPLGRLKALLDIAHSMVSVDTGPAHLAAALGCPLVVLFGGRSPRTWAPRSGRGGAVSVVGGLPECQRVDQIQLETVVDAWHRLPSRGVPDAPSTDNAPHPRLGPSSTSPLAVAEGA